jgi:hypothetical protein
MPRKGKGQKVQTATGQQYGAAKEQEDMQRQAPLPEMPTMQRAKPGQAGAFSRPTERPNELVTAPLPPQNVNQPSPFSPKIARVLPTLLPMASSAFVGEDTKEIINKLIAMVPIGEM